VPAHRTARVLPRRPAEWEDTVSTIIDVADAVTASLNAGTFSPPFTAQRRYQPRLDLAQLQTLRVSVVPKSVTTTAASRRDGFVDSAVDIGIQQKVTAGDPSQVDALLDLVEQINDHLRLTPLASFPGALWVSAAHEPVFASEHL